MGALVQSNWCVTVWPGLSGRNRIYKQESRHNVNGTCAESLPLFFFYTVPTKAELMHVFPTFPASDDLVHEVVFTSFYNCSVLIGVH